MQDHDATNTRNRFKMTQSTGAASARMRHPGTRRLFEYWTELTGARPAPYRSEVTAQGLGRGFATNAFVLENLGDGNIRFRVAGSGLRDIFGLELRGMSALSVFREDDRNRFRALVEAALERPCVGLAQCLAATPAGDPRDVELILAPLRSDFDEMNRVLGGFHVIGDPIVEPSLRRCVIQSACTLRLERDASEIDGPLAGFADEEAAFSGPDGPRLTAIEGGKRWSARSGDRRSGHLKVVTETWTEKGEK